MQHPLKFLSKRVTETLSFSEILTGLVQNQNIEINAAVGSLPAILVAALFEAQKRSILWVAAEQETALQVKDDLEILLPAKSSTFFPKPRKSKWGHDDLNVITQQTESLQHLSNKTALICVTSLDALTTKVRSPRELSLNTIAIAVGDDVSFDEVISQLVDNGFEREQIVDKPGVIAVRGGILDVFPFTAAHPMRIEFWGNRVESIREFDATTQRSTQPLHEVIVYPRVEQNTDAETTVIDFLPEDAVVVVDDMPALQKLLSDTSDDSGLPYPIDDELLVGRRKRWHQIQGARFQKIYFSHLAGNFAECKIKVPARHHPPLQGDIKLLAENFRNNRQIFEAQNIFLCESAGHAARMLELFQDHDLDEADVKVIGVSLQHGFALPEDGIFVYTDHEFYSRVRRQKLRRHFREGLTLRQIKTLAIGDYVVHADHGVGWYRGLEKIKVRGNERECLLLEYKDGDKLYVPLDKMDRVQKYSGKDGVVPTVHKLGSQEWLRLKNRTKAKAKDIAKELVQLYAQRRTEKGFRFSTDTTWQRELEASFVYEDTPDQARSTHEVKNDMEDEKPMDRLIAGDVGYGKTEIAIRAAFKAVQDGKQVAVLVPTTILAEQHYYTFKDRLARFPVRVEVLSRFRTAAVQKKIIAKLKTGEVDIIIGTHRLFSKDVVFKDLGLLVIDEEHRFGVKHKERLKQLRINVDVLTLSATPIPRTLHISLLGIRDMSQIKTPPRDRLPVHTEVIEFDKGVIRDAILREVGRGGQVFFVHNRVKTIYHIARMLSEIVPEVDIAVAHGQMKETELEKVMMEFVRNQHQVLVSTMIIESGLDMPNANTIFVNRADWFGIAELYQLRGRVGRSHQKAYCYLLIPQLRSLTPEAIRRLETIEEFTDLGSGMQIAMRDLEIRGAGNLLGAEQSGFIAQMGFETYLKILEEAVAELKAEASGQKAATSELPEECRVDADVDAYLPQTYVEVPTERVDIYRRLAHASDHDEVAAVFDEIEDRFGKMPDEAENLFHLAMIRLLGRKIGIKVLRMHNRNVVGYFAESHYQQHGDRFRAWLGRVVAHSTRPIEFVQDKGLGIKINFTEDKKPMYALVRFLQALVAPDTAPMKLPTAEHKIEDTVLSG